MAVTPIATPVSVALANEKPGSPLQWLYHLDAKLELQKPDLVWLEDYYRGFHRTPLSKDPAESPAMQQLLARMLEQSGSNFMRLVVDAMVQRIRMQGFRLKDDSNDHPDQETWEMFQANNLESLSQVGWQVTLTQRRAYYSVWYPQPGDDARYPVIRIESPLQCIVEHAPGDRRRRVAGLKVWLDEWTGAKHANVFLPDAVHKFRFEARTPTKPYSGWVVRGESVPNPLGEVPIVPVVNRPSLLRDPDGWSEIEDLIPIQDRINQTLFNRQVAEHFAAFRQKWATGLEIPTGENGKPVDTMSSAINKFWQNEDPQGKFGQFEATDLKNYASPRESDIQDIAVISSTPRHYFTVNGQAPSGDSMKSAETGLVAKILNFEEWAAGSLKEVARLARKVKGLDTPVDSEVVWADPEYQTLGQLVDAQVKLYSQGVVDRATVLEAIGKKPGAIARIEAKVLQEQMMRDAIEAAAAERVPDAGTAA